MALKIVDEGGKFILEVKTGGNIVYETVTETSGIFKAEDFMRMSKAYSDKIYPMFRGKKWVKCSDVRHYKTSMVVPEMTAHIAEAAKNGMERGCLITESVINKSQVTRGAGGRSSSVAPEAFNTVEEGVNWLHSLGYKG